MLMRSATTGLKPNSFGKTSIGDKEPEVRMTFRYFEKMFFMAILESRQNNCKSGSSLLRFIMMSSSGYGSIIIVKPL